MQEDRLDRSLALYAQIRQYVRMPIKRVALNISVPTQEEKEDILAKANDRGMTVSQIIIAYFRRLPRRSK